MTLSTRVVIHEDTDWPALHAWVNENLIRPEDWSAERKVEVYPDETDGIFNVIGQGLESLVRSHFNGKPIDWLADYDDEDIDDDTREYYAGHPTGSGYIMFDNPYGGTIRGMSAWTLHAYYIQRLAQEYLIPRGLTFSWQDESSGKWFEGMNGFGELFKSGDSASEWFEGVVKPTLSTRFNIVDPEDL